MIDPIITVITQLLLLGVANHLTIDDYFAFVKDMAPSSDKDIDIGTCLLENSPPVPVIDTKADDLGLLAIHLRDDGDNGSSNQSTKNKKYILQSNRFHREIIGKRKLL